MKKNNASVTNGCIRANKGKWIVGVDNINKVYHILPTNCKQWDCPHCRLYRTKLHRERIAHGVEVLHARKTRTFFFTITFMRLAATIPDAMCQLRIAWNKLNTKIGRLPERTGLHHTYAIVPEISPVGRLHLHGVSTALRHEFRWNDILVSAGFGWRFKSEELYSARKATFYVTKYLSKDLEHSEFPKRSRRVRYSSDFPVRSDKAGNAIWRTLGKRESIRSLIAEGHAKSATVRLNGKEIDFDIWDYVPEHGREENQC